MNTTTMTTVIEAARAYIAAVDGGTKGMALDDARAAYMGAAERRGLSAREARELLSALRA